MNPRHHPPALKFRFKAEFSSCFLQQAMNCRHLHFCGAFHARASEPFSKHKSVQPHNLSQRFGNRIAGITSFPTSREIFGWWEARGGKQRLFNSHLTRYLDSSEEPPDYSIIPGTLSLRHGSAKIPQYPPLPFWLCFFSLFSMNSVL